MSGRGRGRGSTLKMEFESFLLMFVGQIPRKNNVNVPPEPFRSQSMVIGPPTNSSNESGRFSSRTRTTNRSNTLQNEVFAIAKRPDQGGIGREMKMIDLRKNFSFCF